MYCDYFGLREQPFNNTPDPHFFFPTADHEEALATLMYGVSRYKGFLMLSGEVGTGKTLVSRVMLHKFGDSITFANIANTYVSPLELLQAICDEFHIAYAPDAGNLQLSKLLEQFLLTQFARNMPAVLVVDEAQNLSHKAFEQLRMIGNLESDDAKLLQIVMVGQCELRTRFQKPQLRQLRQRIFRSYHLPALGRKACEAYIEHRLKVAGHPDGKLFSEDALDTIAAFSRGLPRTINNICDSTLLAAYSQDRGINQGLVRSVIEQMMTLELETQQAESGEGRSLTADRSREPNPAKPAQPQVTARPTSQTDVSTGTDSVVDPNHNSVGDRQSTAHPMTTREQRILQRLAAISRDITQEREQAQSREAERLSANRRRASDPLPMQLGLRSSAQAPTLSETARAPGKSGFDVASLAALRKSVAECRLALDQLNRLDDPAASTAANSSAPDLDTTHETPALSLQPAESWLVGV